MMLVSFDRSANRKGESDARLCINNVYNMSHKELLYISFAYSKIDIFQNTLLAHIVQ